MKSIFLKIRKKLFRILVKYTHPSSVRVWCLKMCNYQIGEQVYIGEDLIIVDELGRSDVGLFIGDRAAVSPRVTLVLHSAPNWSRIRPYVNEQYGDIKINSDAWIGTGAVILPNVEIGEGAIVGANSVVTRNVPDYTVVAGVPAREVKRVEVPWANNKETIA